MSLSSQLPGMMNASWLLLQLSDGTFPSGGFAHSGGLEAAMVLGGLGGDVDADATTGLEGFLDAMLEQVAHAALPFVRAATMTPALLAEIDAAYDATLSMQGPNRASRAQGRALASAASRVWDEAAAIGAHARTEPAHHAPVFGALFGVLGVAPRDALRVFLHGSARSVLSAGVRLGLLGPLEAQRLHAARAPLLETLLDVASDLELDLEDAAQTAPLLEIYGALHERLDGRMFQS